MIKHFVTPPTNFEPPAYLRNPHLMTIASALVPRGIALKDFEPTLIKISDETSLLAHCHISQDKQARPTFLLVHGLEGSADSFNVCGLAEKAIKAGANVIRLNLRNCGNTMHLTPTLYNAGMSSDVLAVIDWLTDQKGLRDLFIVGFSLGGNTVLKTGAELAERRHFVSGICAISPSIDLKACVTTMESGFGRIYAAYFLHSLRSKIRQKNRFFPGQYDLAQLKTISSIRQFDHIYTAADGGYESAEHYYAEASAKPLISKISVPTLIVAAKDDPIVPFSIFSDVQTDYVQLLAPTGGGHGAFISCNRSSNLADDMRKSRYHFWADEPVLRFCSEHSKV